MRSFLFVMFVASILFDAVDVTISSSTTLHLYQLFIPFIFFYLIVNVGKINKLLSYEIVFFIFYFYLATTFYLADDKTLALRLIILEIILIILYLYLKIGFSYFTIKKFELFLYKLGKFYIIISFLLYLLGLYIHSVSPTMGESLYFGLMQESILPRLRGLASSPNEYVPWALFFLVYFMYFKSFKLVLFTFVTIILSFSTTGMLIAMILLLIYYNNKITFKGILLLFILLVISISVYYLYIDTNKDIMDMIQWRMERNKSGTGRFELWVYALDLINQNIWGYGINQTRILIHDFHALNSVHNSIIEVFLTGGFIGLYLYLLFSIILLLQSIMIWKNNKDSKILLFYIIFILIGMANNTLHIVYVIFYLAILSRYSILQGEQVHAK